ncbi:ABC transporter ATP-binding protein [Halioxenophilus aromaticivorans]|uniref:ABC transporter ATP-binding protein n=2 Tax=Halioxenophilus aromaticivorans TaxID=1306992 RepID=A0AAV3U9Z6_9ALTE
MNLGLVSSVDLVFEMMDVGNMKLQADELRVARGGKEILHGLSFHVSAGEVYALLGGNGAGKSTTLLSFLGFIEPTSGAVNVNGQSVTSNLTQARSAIAYLAEAAKLYEHLDARENLTYFLQLADKQVDSNAIEAALDRVALRGDARGQRLKGYSKGMRQKVAIALAILRDTDILLLDEPTSGLDPTAIDEFHHLVRALADAGKAILMVTHDVYGACHVADKIGLLKSGNLVGEFTAEAGQSIDTELVHRAFAQKDAP